MAFNYNHFARMPNIDYPRSKYKMPYKCPTSFNHGQLIPIHCFMVGPGDAFTLKLSSLIRMSTPIAPIMDDIEAHIHAYFVPMRLVWNDTAKFFGENTQTAGPIQNPIQKPLASMDSSGLGDVAPLSLSHYLGKPYTAGSSVKVDFFKERGYYIIWNEHYRAQQVQNPVLLDTSSNIGIGTLNGSPLYFSSYPLNVGKKMDYFTSCTLQPQYGPTVTLPLGSYAPLVAEKGASEGSYPSDYPIELALSDGVNSSDLKSGVYWNGNYGGYTSSGSLYVDLSNATAASINSIRYAFACQKYLERCNFGTRYFEILAAHYGVTSPDATLQRPEYLGGTMFNININQVTSTAGYAAGVTTTVGETGAVSVTANTSTIFTKGFCEFGYVYILISTVHDRSYCQGVQREDTFSDRFEFYSPEFANLGDQEVWNKEVMLTGTNDELPFGCQEHWAEMTTFFNRATGLLDPNVPGALDFWTLAEKFATRPQLSNSFIQENRDCLTRCLKTGATGPDYIASFYFDYTATREKSLYTIPGLVDHVGNM